MECAICFEILGDANSGRSGLLENGRKGVAKKAEVVDEVRPSTSSSANRYTDLCNFKKQSADLSCTPCGHIFHRRCIRSWLKKGDHGRNSNRPCPICRKTIHGDLDLRIVFLNYLENCRECAQWMNDYGKLEQEHQDQWLSHCRELEVAQETLKNSGELMDKLKQELEDTQAQLEKERQNTMVHTKDMEKRYDTLMKAFKSLLQKYKVIIGAKKVIAECDHCSVCPHHSSSVNEDALALSESSDLLTSHNTPGEEKVVKVMDSSITPCAVHDDDYGSGNDEVSSSYSLTTCSPNSDNEGMAGKRKIPTSFLFPKLFQGCFPVKSNS